MARDTESFLALLQAQNERIAAQQAAAEIQPQLDPIREERDKERRAKWGQLRARERPSKRHNTNSSVFGYTDLS